MVMPYRIQWAGVELPGRGEGHFGIVGISGSGKTLAVQALARTVIPTIQDADPRATAQRALIFDPENKFVPFMQRLAGAQNVHVFNPFDRRSRPWDLANEIEDMASAQEMASNFVPERPGDSQPFWQRNARAILSAVFKALHLRAPGKWTLRHVFHIMTSQSRLETVLRATDQTQSLLEVLEPTNTTLFNVLAELRSHVDMLEIIAALWDNSVRLLGSKPITINEWLSGRSVLVLGRPTHLEDTFLIFNRVFLRRLSQLIRAPMSREQINARGQTWIFIEEIRNVGQLLGVEKLLTEGRGRGARVVITFQDIEGLREVYGAKVAEEIANQCDTMSYLRCRGTTAKWASQRIGRGEYWDKDTNRGGSQTSGGNGSTTNNWGVHYRKQVSETVLESELSRLDLAQGAVRDGKPGAFVQGWHEVPQIRCVYPTHGQDAWYQFEPRDEEGQFMPRPPEHQVLRPWEDGDWAELGLGRNSVSAKRPLPNRAMIESLRGNRS